MVKHKSRTVHLSVDKHCNKSNQAITFTLHNKLLVIDLCSSCELHHMYTYFKMIDIIQVPIILVMGMTVTCLEPRLVETLTGKQEDLCSIYPLCADYGPGKHEILEDCTKYIECEEQPDGFYTRVRV